MNNYEARLSTLGIMEGSSVILSTQDMVPLNLILISLFMFGNLYNVADDKVGGEAVGPGHGNLHSLLRLPRLLGLPGLLGVRQALSFLDPFLSQTINV